MIFQRAEFTGTQFMQWKAVKPQHMINPPLFLFADDAANFFRTPGSARSHYNGDARYAGHWDRDKPKNLTFGIVTHWNIDRPAPQTNSEWKAVIAKQFKFVFLQINSGRDIIIRGPTEFELISFQKILYWKGITQPQAIHHMIGVGPRLEQQPFGAEIVKIIQQQIEKVKSMARSIECTESGIVVLPPQEYIDKKLLIWPSLTYYNKMVGDNEAAAPGNYCISTYKYIININT